LKTGVILFYFFLSKWSLETGPYGKFRLGTHLHRAFAYRLPIKWHQTLLPKPKHWLGVCLLPGDDLPLAVSLQNVKSA
jgi:hypothetical protein